MAFNPHEKCKRFYSTFWTIVTDVKDRGKIEHNGFDVIVESRYAFFVFEKFIFNRAIRLRHECLFSNETKKKFFP